MLRNNEARPPTKKRYWKFLSFLKSKNENRLFFSFKSGQHPPYCQDIFQKKILK